MMEPGSVKGMQAVVADAAAVREDLLGRGLEVSEVADLEWGSFVYFTDPDGNAWSLQQLPAWSTGAGGTGERPEA
jgi:uncharacterized glyoxalase superfamily protein PhnB